MEIFSILIIIFIFCLLKGYNDNVRPLRTNFPDKNPNDFSKSSSSTNWKKVDYFCENCYREVEYICDGHYDKIPYFCSCGAYHDTFQKNKYCKRLIIKNNKWIPQYRKIQFLLEKTEESKII